MVFRYKHLLPIFITVLSAILFQPNGFSQEISKKIKDSLASALNGDTVIPAIVGKVEAYSFTIDRSSYMVKKKYNIAPIAVALPPIETILKAFKSRLQRKGRLMNLRGLNSAVILIGESADKLTNYQNLLTDYSSQLAKSNAEVKKIIADPMLHSDFVDSVLMSQLDDVLAESLSLDTLQRKTLTQINLMRNRVSIALLQANDIVSDMGYQTMALKMAIWQQDDLPLMNAKPIDYSKSFEEVLTFGLQRSRKIIDIYVGDKWDVITWCLLFFLFVTTWCIANMRRVKKLEDANRIMEQVYFFKRGVLVASLFGLFTYSPFFFANPTMSYLHATEALRLATLSFLLFPYLPKPSKVVWAMICLLWMYFALDDILLESAFGERWGLFIASLLLIAVCIKLIGTKKPLFVGIQESTATKALVIFTLAQAVLSVFFNLTGRVALAKILGVSAIQCLILGLALKVFCTLVLEAIYLQTEAYKDSRFSAFINFKELQYRFRRVLWILACIVWLVSLIRNWSLYDTFTSSTAMFISQNRSIGRMNFTFQSVVVFFFIIWISTVISKFINFFFGHEATKIPGKRSALGSILLLVKLAIWALGFLIAAAAAGITLDKLSLVVGALSVGIGFGLQNIVNNLVSGIILAFEQPIQVGDQIEVGNKAGMVKEIGVRSSKIKSGDGADIIIPNGDLLSQHLINWTMQNRNKRVEFTMGIPYTADILMVKTLIENVLEKNEDILHTPAPVVIVQALGEKSIDVRVMFWAPDLSAAGSVRSNAMISILQAMVSAGVELPCPPK